MILSLLLYRIRVWVSVNPTHRSQDLKRSFKRHGKNKCMLNNRRLQRSFWISASCCASLCCTAIPQNIFLISTDTAKIFPSFCMHCSLAPSEQLLFNLEQNTVYVPVVEFIFILPPHSFMVPLCLIKQDKTILKWDLESKPQFRFLKQIRLQS